MDKSEVIRVLDEAKKVLIEKGWTQGYYAKDAQGELVGIHDGDACSFCAVGAIHRASEDASDWARDEAGNAVVAVTPGFNIPIYNDAKGRTKDEILALFDKAKEQVNGQG